MERKRICLMIPSLQAGGMERVMSELAYYFSLKIELDVHLLLYGLTREIFYKIPVSIVIHSPSFRFNNGIRFFNTVRTVLFLRRTVNSIKPDSILSFGEYWNTFVLISLIGLQFPIYISDRCSPEKEFSAMHKFLRAMFYPRTRGIIAQTSKAKEIYINLFKRTNIQMIGNPIRNIVADGSIERQNIVLMVGRLIKTKHQDKLIEIFLKIDNPDWKLVLVGYDHLKQNISRHLQEIIARYQAAGRVLITGRQENVDNYYRLSKIFAFTSSSEGFPNAIGEAMSAGIPVVAFDCVAGPSEMIIDGYNGYLIPLFDYNQFRTKLELLMNDENLRSVFGKRASADIKKFSIQRIGEQYLHYILGNYRK